MSPISGSVDNLSTTDGSSPNEPGHSTSITVNSSLSDGVAAEGSSLDTMKGLDREIISLARQSRG